MQKIQWFFSGFPDVDNCWMHGLLYKRRRRIQPTSNCSTPVLHMSTLQWLKDLSV